MLQIDFYFQAKEKDHRKQGGLFSGEWNCYLNKGNKALAKPVSAAKIALTIAATISLPPSHIRTRTKLTINILNLEISFNMKCVKNYTLKLHEQNNEVLIDTNSYMRMIAYNEFINFYKILIFCKEMYIGRLHLAIIHLKNQSYIKTLLWCTLV